MVDSKRYSDLQVGLCHMWVSTLVSRTVISDPMQNWAKARCEVMWMSPQGNQRHSRQDVQGAVQWPPWGQVSLVVLTASAQWSQASLWPSRLVRGALEQECTSTKRGGRGTSLTWMQSPLAPSSPPSGLLLHQKTADYGSQDGCGCVRFGQL